jgi:DNA (cytosine-5)-methyltransferase 1
MKVLSLFSGIGAFEKALDNLGIEFELVNYCEVDKYASKSYSAIHNIDESMNLGDITKVNEKELPKDIDLITYGFPCQDISLAGKQKGLFNEDGTQTRSGLFFEALRIIKETQPKVAIAENVKNLVGKKFKEQFKIVKMSLEEANYNVYWKVLNSKDFGIPQNRERVFIIAIRKDVDTGMFQFPQGFPLELRLKDMLENEVDEKYYLSNKTTEKLKRHKNKIIDNDNPEVSGTIHAGYFKMGGRDQQYIKEKAICVLNKNEKSKQEVIVNE